MLLNPIDPETQRKQALARVYALLIRLADESETVDSDNLGGAALSTAQQQDPKERSLTNE